MTAPFGVELHQPLSQSSRIADVGNGKIEISAPRPHPSFTRYIVEESKSHGVVWLKAISDTIENDAYGTSVKAQLDKIAAQLQTRYGKSQFVDRLSLGSIWNEPRDWVASLHQNERAYFHLWEAGKQTLPEDIATVFVGILTYSHDDAAIIVEYASSKHEQAEQDRDSDLADLF